MLLVSLVGEQPIPNYIPIRHYCPEKALLVYTKKTQTYAVRLKDSIRKVLSSLELYLLEVHPYRMDEIYEKIKDQIQEGDDVWFNITGGTKMMSTAAILLAAHMQKNILYYQTDLNMNRLYRYVVQNGRPQQIGVDDLGEDVFTLEEYLTLYLGSYRSEGYHIENGKLTNGGGFEQSVGETLKEAGFEVLSGIRPAGEGNQLEIDLAFRLGNQVGIAEVKLGDKEKVSIKKGMDQLALASQREYLGTYVHRFLITGRNPSPSQKKLAHAHDISVISLEEYNSLSPNLRQHSWKKKLVDEVKRKMKST